MKQISMKLNDEAAVISRKPIFAKNGTIQKPDDSYISVNVDIFGDVKIGHNCIIEDRVVL